jgi:hypothetical protein
VHQIDIRAPLALRIAFGIFYFGFSAFLVLDVAWSSGHGKNIGAVAAAAGTGVAGAAGAAAGWWLTRISCCGNSQELVIHNIFSTHRLPISQIEGFDIAGALHLASPGPQAKTVRVLTGRRAIPITVLFPTYLIGRRQQLAGWLAAARPQADRVGTGETASID